MPVPMSFLQVRGLLDEVMVYKPLPGYESPARRQPGGAADTGEIDLIALDAGRTGPDHRPPPCVASRLRPCR
jgi:hypothetical protein